MATSRKEEVDAARHRQEKRWATGLGSCYRTRKRRTCEATSIGLVNKSNESCTDARRTETCVAPKHEDASFDALLATCYFCSFSCTSSVGAGGERPLPNFPPPLFSRPRAGLATV